MARRSEPVLVVGLGRFGSALALELVREGTEVLAVDPNPVLVQRMAGQLERVVTADPTDPQVLDEIGAREFHNAVVAIGGELSPSVLATSLLSDLGIPNIWAKAMNTNHARILSRVGAHHVIFPEKESGERVAHLISGRILDYVEIDANWVLAKARPPRYLVGVPLGETGLRAKHKVTVVSVRKEGTEHFIHADAGTVLSYGDDIVVVGRPLDVEAFADTI